MNYISPSPNTGGTFFSFFYGMKQLFIISFFLLSHLAVGQTKLEIVQAGSLAGDRSNGHDWQFLVDEVILRQGETLLYCDSALLDKTDNKAKMYGNVRIEGDSANLKCDSLYYKGNSKKAMAFSRVRLDHKGLSLKTEVLNWDRENDIAYYLTEGFIKDGDKDLYSKKGTYDLQKEEFFFRDSVRLKHPSYEMEGDTLLYNSNTEVSYFYGPSYIYSESSTIYCENGWYNTISDRAQFNKNAVLTTETQTLKGDSLYYDRIASYGQGFQNVELKDTAEGVRIIGDYGIYYESLKIGKLWDSATAILDFGGDSMYLHADTLKWQNDSADAARLSSYPFTRFFQKSMAGQCDSLHYSENDSMMYMFRDPILWSGVNQIVADSIRMKMKGKGMDKMYLRKNAFIVSEEDSIRYQQIKGKNMLGFFNTDELYRIDVNGNGQSIYFVTEDDGDFLGINVVECSDMRMYLKNNDVQTISFINKPASDLWPPEDLPRAQWYLEQFNWLGAWRPDGIDDIYVDPRVPAAPEESDGGTIEP